MASIRAKIVAAALLALAAPLAAQPDDGAGIHAMVRAQEAAFNTHDAAAYARFLEPDADMVTSLGWRVAGRDAYAKKLAEVFKGPLRAARLHADDIAVRMLAPDLALVHITWTDTAARKPASAIETQILHRDGGRWLIAASQETEITPERAAKADAAATVPQPTRKCLLARANGDCLLYK